MDENELDYKGIIEALQDKSAGKSMDRRKKKDWITKMPVALTLISWAILAAVWVLLDQAAPLKDYGWLSFFDGYNTPNRPWQRVPVNISYILLMVSIGLCVVAFGFNKMRMRRKTDKLKISVFFVGIVSVVAFVAFLIYFIPRNIIGYW